MNIKELDIPYQYDVTAITSIFNSIIIKMQEVANEYMVTLRIKPYDNIDLVKITEIYNLIAAEQVRLCDEIGLPTGLAAMEYGVIDYNGIIAATSYSGGSLNDIIGAAQNMNQNEPYKGWKDEKPIESW